MFNIGPWELVAMVAVALCVAVPAGIVVLVVLLVRKKHHT